MPRRSDVESVRFGTDGWRGIVARDFTFDNVARAAQAIADYLHSDERPSDPIYTDWGTECRDASHGVVVGYDTRFLSESFALHCAAVKWIAPKDIKKYAFPTATVKIFNTVTVDEFSLS